MPIDHDLFVEKRAGERLKSLRGERRRAVFGFIDALANNPFIEGEIQFEDRKGRLLQKLTVSGFVITFHVDHAITEVKIMTLE
ncbi:MAG: hypothetical protein MK080_10295 [Opitutales bacterium]|nr:hypothetical protein [Opitutales bacterium]NRA28573.1 hypothetical protein [Opitutales bacterium]